MSAATPLAFRFAELADISVLVALIESAYRGEASRVGWTTEADFLDGQRTDAAAILVILRDPESRMLLAERDGALLACCHVQRQEGVCYFGMFSVRPGCQSSGVGRIMLTEAERFAREDWHCDEMQMTVISIREELIAWYERRGYSRSGIYKPFPYGDERFGIPRRDDLRFEMLGKRLQENASRNRGMDANDNVTSRAS